MANNRSQPDLFEHLGGRHILISKKRIYGAEDILSVAGELKGMPNSWRITYTLKGPATARLDAVLPGLSRQDPNGRIVQILDEKIASMPVVIDGNPSGGAGGLSTELSRSESLGLAIVLRFPPLPSAISLEAIRNVTGGGVSRHVFKEISEGKLSPNERKAVAALRQIAKAQAEFRAKDRDRNGLKDYWTGDVAGLYAIDNSSSKPAKTKPIALINISIALADRNAMLGRILSNGNYETPVTRYGKQAPCSGYWFQALISDQGPEGFAKDTDGSGDFVHNLKRFGFCAMPALYGKTGLRVFIINEKGDVYCRDFGQAVFTEDGDTPPELSGVWTPDFPTLRALKGFWRRVK